MTPILSNLSGTAGFHGKLAKNGKGLMVRVMDHGQQVAMFYLPLDRSALRGPGANLTGKVLQITAAGQFEPLDPTAEAEAIQTIMFFVRRRLGDLLD